MSNKQRKARRKEAQQLQNKMDSQKFNMSKLYHLHCPVCEEVLSTSIELRDHVLINHKQYPYLRIKRYINRLEIKFDPSKKEEPKPAQKPTFSKRNFKIISKRGTRFYENFVCKICGVTVGNIKKQQLVKLLYAHIVKTNSEKPD